MKFLIFVFFTIFSVIPTGSVKYDLKKLYHLDQLKIDITEEYVRELLNELDLIRSGEITAIVNEFADRILANIPDFVHNNGLDPIPLPDIDQSFLTASITMKNGTLGGIGSIHRNGDVVCSYDSNKKLLITVPIEFGVLEFNYLYHIIIFLIGPDGGLEGKISNFNIHFSLGFDFNTYAASIDEFSLTNTGHISVKFTGNGLIDAIVNILSEFVTTILHPLIVGIVQGIVESALNSVIDLINSIIQSILHPGSTTLPAII